MNHSVAVEGSTEARRRLWGWVALAFCTALALALAWKLKLPCLHVARWNGHYEYSTLCYSDLIPFWQGRGLAKHLWLYLQHPFEYPVLAGAAVQWASAGVGSVGVYFARICFLLGLATVVSVWGVTELIGGPRLRAFWYVLSPPIVLCAFYNFEQLAALGLVLGMVALARGRLAWAGILFGLGAAVKLFPGAAGVGVMMALVGAGRIRDGARIGVATLGTFVVVNLPVVAINPAGWWATYAFHAHRTADWGTLQFVLATNTHMPLTMLTHAGDVLGALALAGVFAAIALIARRRPFPLECAAALGVVALLWVNKVGSPQFVLWVWPLLIVLDIDLGWSLLLALLASTHLIGIFRWFGTGLVHSSQWKTLFELSVVARWGELAALTGWLLFRRPALLARARSERAG